MKGKDQTYKNVIIFQSTFFAFPNSFVIKLLKKCHSIMLDPKVQNFPFFKHIFQRKSGFETERS